MQNDYFFNTDEAEHSNKKLVLVIYDIVDNKSRLTFSKLLEQYGVRVQKSAFEMIINNKQYNDLISKIPHYVSEDDNVRVYRLKAEGNVKAWGSDILCAEEIIII